MSTNILPCVRVASNSSVCASHGNHQCISGLLWAIEEETAKGNSTANIPNINAPQCMITGCQALGLKKGICDQHSNELSTNPAVQAQFLKNREENPLQQFEPALAKHQRQAEASNNSLQLAYAQQQQAVADHLQIKPSEAFPNSSNSLQLAYAQQQQAVADHLNHEQRVSPPANAGFWKPNNFESFKQEVLQLPGQELAFHPHHAFGNDSVSPKACGWGQCMNVALIQSLCHQHAAKYQSGQRPPGGAVNTAKYLGAFSPQHPPPRPGSFMASLAEAVQPHAPAMNAPANALGISDIAMLASAQPSYEMQQSLPVPPVSQLLQHHLQSANKGPKKNYKACHSPGCTKYAQRQGLCRMHEKIKNGEPLHTRSGNSSGRLYRMCCYPDCDKHSQKYHVCRTHEKQLAEEAHAEANRISGDYHQLFKSRLAKLKICRHPDGCKNIIRAKGCCTEHLPRDSRDEITNNYRMNQQLLAQFQQVQNTPGSPVLALPNNTNNNHHGMTTRKSQQQPSSQSSFHHPVMSSSTIHNHVQTPKPESNDAHLPVLMMGFSSPPPENHHQILDDKVCLHVGCTAAPEMDGCCALHYVRRCDMEKCTRLADKNGLCLVHRKATMCKVTTCVTMVSNGKPTCGKHEVKDHGVTVMTAVQCTYPNCPTVKIVRPTPALDDHVPEHHHQALGQDQDPDSDSRAQDDDPEDFDVKARVCAVHRDMPTCGFENCPRYRISNEADFCAFHAAAKICSESECEEWTFSDTKCQDHGGEGPPPLIMPPVHRAREVLSFLEAGAHHHHHHDVQHRYATTYSSSGKSKSGGNHSPVMSQHSGSGEDFQDPNECQFYTCRSEPMKPNGFCPEHVGTPVCSKDECSKKVFKNGLCPTHGGRPICRHHGCIKFARTSGLCGNHGGGRRCNVPGCDSISQSKGKCRKHNQSSSASTLSRMHSTASSSHSLQPLTETNDDPFVDPASLVVGGAQAISSQIMTV